MVQTNDRESFLIWV